MIYQRDDRNRGLDSFLNPQELKRLELIDFARKVVHHSHERNPNYCERIINDIAFRCYPINSNISCPLLSCDSRCWRTEILYKGKVVLSREKGLHTEGRISKEQNRILEELMKQPTEMLKSAQKTF